jgi:predicted AAA+ superfamily ATPase
MRPRHINLLDSGSYFLFGARGTGKSTLLRQHLEGKRVLWIDLLRSTDEIRYSDRPDLLSDQLERERDKLEWVVIDEVQKVPKLLDVVHREIERSRFLGVGPHFALSGSSARKLKREGSNLLAARAFVNHLFPFTHREIGEDFDLASALYFGTIPAIVHFSDSQSRQAALEAYVDTYLKEEIVQEQIIRKVSPFRKFLQLSAQANGTVVNFSNIAKDLKVDDKTVRVYFDILEDTLLGFYLPAFEKSLRKQQIKSPKFYLFDPGVKRVLDPNLPASAPLSSQQFGAAFEHFIVCEFFRLKSYLRRKMNLSHFNTGSLEIDLVIETPGIADTFVEIKATTQVTEAHLVSLHRLRRDFPRNRYICLSQDPIARIESGVEVLPWVEGIRLIMEGS